MRVTSSIVALSAVVWLGIVSPAGAQEIVAADADQGPRFLLASASRLVPLDFERTPALARRLELNLQGVTLKRALVEISIRAGLRLAFSDNDVPLNRRVDLRAQAITVAAALTDVLFGTGVDVVFGRDGGASLVSRAEHAVAQPGRIVGQVTDQKTQQGLAGAEVWLEGTKWRVLTGDDGRYVLGEVEPGSYSITTRRIGYGRQRKGVAVVAGQETTADFALDPALTRLEEVVVTGTIRPTELKAVPTPISVITGDEIQQKGYQRVDQIFRGDVPGAIAWDRGHINFLTDINVRGGTSLTGSSNVKTYIDGVGGEPQLSRDARPEQYRTDRGAARAPRLDPLRLER